MVYWFSLICAFQGSNSILFWIIKQDKENIWEENEKSKFFNLQFYRDKREKNQITWASSSSGTWIFFFLIFKIQKLENFGSFFFQWKIQRNSFVVFFFQNFQNYFFIYKVQFDLCLYPQIKRKSRFRKSEQIFSLSKFL